MAAAVEFDSSLRRDDGSHVVVGDGRGELLRRGVEVRDVGVVVLQVVELHDRAADHGLERRVLVAEGRQRRLRARWRAEEARGPVRVMRFCARTCLSRRRRRAALREWLPESILSAAARRANACGRRQQRRLFSTRRMFFDA